MFTQNQGYDCQDIITSNRRQTLKSYFRKRFNLNICPSQGFEIVFAEKTFPSRNFLTPNLLISTYNETSWDKYSTMIRKGITMKRVIPNSKIFWPPAPTRKLEVFNSVFWVLLGPIKIDVLPIVEPWCFAVLSIFRFIFHQSFIFHLQLNKSFNSKLRNKKGKCGVGNGSWKVRYEIGKNEN